MYKYNLIDLSDITNSHKLCDDAFRLWEQIYSEIFQDAGEKLNVDEFWRSRILATISTDDEMVGFHLYNSWDLRCPSIHRHSYIRNYPPESISIGINTLMSMEYLTVNPKFRAKRTGFSVGEVIIGLGLQVLRNSPWDCCVGMARADYKVDQMIQKMGGHIGAELNIHDKICHVVTAKKENVKPHVDPAVQDIIDRLWAHKTNETSLIIDSPNWGVKAA